LDAQEIVKTAEQIHCRIKERFPASSLAQLAAELVGVAQATTARAAWVARPHRWLRTAIGMFLLALCALLVSGLLHYDPHARFGENLSDVLQGLDAGINEVVFLSVAVVFLFSLEGRVKRARALSALHELRSLAHLIDMYQLTKDPERIVGPPVNTASSPERPLSPFELVRYLDYCSEMLAIVSKIAAIYAEHFRDPVALAAVDAVEDLAAGLSRKIWQKLMIVAIYEGRRVVPSEDELPAGEGRAAGG
jgi:hypothetical protein